MVHTIDIEEYVFDEVYKAIGSDLPAGCLVSEYVPVAEKLPLVSFVEIANLTYRSGQDNRLRENFALIAYDVNIYAPKKEQCRAIAAKLDQAMLNMQFDRSSPGLHFMVNLNDPAISRINILYEAVTDGARIFRQR